MTFAKARERRFADRLPVLVPVSIVCGDVVYNGKLVNIVAGGALIETSASVPLHARFDLRCGTIATRAFVVWRDSTRYGVKFLQPLTEAQLVEQVSRTSALKARAPNCLTSVTFKV